MNFIFIFEGWLLIKDFFKKQSLIKVSFNKTIFDAYVEPFGPQIAK